MLITCPNCKEIFKKEIGTCPFCKYALTVADVLNDEKEYEEKRARAEEEKIEEHRRRNKKFLISSILFVVCLVGSVPLGLVLQDSEIVAVVLVILTFVIYICYVVLSKCMDCPYCGKSLGREQYGDYCPHCGSRLR
ncbi:MAG: hypothetical protein J5648_06035 [Lachnospiraceae bacterium]|nr:hypothetical protein [Lachnospiraceae bacterium]